jgi:hypothetical protein
MCNLQKTLRKTATYSRKRKTVKGRGIPTARRAKTAHGIRKTEDRIGKPKDLERC